MSAIVGEKMAVTGTSSRPWKDPVVQALIASLENREYAVLHGWRSLPEGPASDVDIVIRESDLPALERALRLHCGARIAQIIRYEGGSGFFFVAVRDCDGVPAFTQIDAATRYSRDGRILLDSDELLEGRWSFEGIRVVSPEAEFAYLLIKKICKRRFPLHQRRRLAELTERLGADAARIAEEVLGHGAAHKVMHDIVESDWEAIESNLNALHRALLRLASRRHRFNSIRYWTAEVKRAVWRWRNPTGFMLVVMGPDGCGKSTLIDHLKTKASPLFWWEAALFHFRPDVWGTTADRGAVLEPHKHPSRNPLTSTLKLGFYGVDFVTGYLKTIRPGLIRSRLMIFDRYYHDLLVDKRRYRYGGSVFLARLFGRLIPNPDMFLMVDAPETIIQERKQELPSEELRRQRAAYRNLAATLPNAVLVDGSAQPQEVARQAHQHIIDRMAARYLRRRRTWFKDDHTETLQWLSLALSQGDSNYISPAQSKRGGRDEFHWLRLGDGRGYLLPANSSSTTLAGLDLYRPQRLKSLLAKTALCVAIKTGAAGVVLKRVHVPRRGSEGVTHGIFDYLHRVTGKTLSYAVSLGTPGPHRKPVLKLMEPDGRLIGFAKVGCNTTTNGLLRNEAETYLHLARFKLQTVGHPQLIHSGRWGSHFVTIQTGPASQAAGPSTIEPYIEAVKELAKVGNVRAPIRETEYLTDLHHRGEDALQRNRAWLIREALQASVLAIGDKRILFHLSHGDLAPWNACMRRDQLFLFDWEYSRTNSPAGWDLFHFFLQTNWLVARQSPSQIIQRLPSFAKSIAEYCQNVDLDPELLRPLFLLYLVERILSSQSDTQRGLGELHLVSSIASILALELMEQSDPGKRSKPIVETRP